MTEIATLGIVGAGQMGRGIAQVCAMRGFGVRLHDAVPDLATAAHGRIARALARQGLDEAAQQLALGRIVPAEDLADMADADMVIEAVVEQDGVKVDIFRRLALVLGPDAILASNTSSLSITALAAPTDRPDRFVGVHFMNPAPRMGLVEIIRGARTSEATVAECARFVERLGKVVVESADYPGFIVNRILITMINEAVFALHEGVGRVRAIDDALRLGANHPMGPLELADLIGLDTVLAIMNRLHLGLGDSKYRPCPLLVKHVEAGWLGRKSGRGFYNYGTNPPEPTR